MKYALFFLHVGTGTMSYLRMLDSNEFNAHINLNKIMGSPLFERCELIQDGNDLNDRVFASPYVKGDKLLHYKGYDFKMTSV